MKFRIVLALMVGSAAAHAQISTEGSTQVATPPTAATPSAADAAVHKIGGAVKPPKVIHSVDPSYTDEARKKKISGEVLLELKVDENGMPQDVKVIRQLGYGLDEMALNAVQQYRFAPATKDGQPVKVVLDILVNFRIYKHWWNVP